MKFLRVVPDTMARVALQRFKSLAETGEIPTTEGSPSGRASGSAWVFGNSRSKVASGLGWFSVGLGLTELSMPRRLASWIGAPDQPLLYRLLGLRELISGIGILSSRQRTAWLWSRVAGDAVDLALLSNAYRSRDSKALRLAVVAATVAGVTAVDALSSWRHTKPNGSATKWE